MFHPTITSTHERAKETLNAVAWLLILELAMFSALQAPENRQDFINYVGDISRTWDEI